MSQYPDLEFYRFDGFCSIIPHILFRELGIPFREVRVGPDRSHGAAPTTPAPEFDQENYVKNVHYGGLTPGLLVDGKPLTETTAIITYLASISRDDDGMGASLLGGEDPLQRAEVVSWITWFSGSMHSVGYGMFFRPLRFVDDEEQQIALVREKGRQLIVKNYQRIEEHLTGRDCFVGDGTALTLPDYYSIIFWLWGNAHGFEMKVNYPNYGRLIKRLEGRRAVREVMDKERQKLTYE